MKKRFNIKEIKNNEDYLPGLRTVIICVLSLILVVGLNLLIRVLPTNTTFIDLTSNRIHSISEETKELVSNINKEVNVYFICENGEENSNSTLMLNLYADMCKKVNVKQIDPALSPEVLASFTSEKIDNNSIIVSSNEKAQIIFYDDYYNNGEFVLEDYLNSAIKFVTADELYKMYYVTGHGEGELSENLISYIGLDGFEIENFNIKELDRVPNDAKGVILNGPSKDITEEEAEVLIDYLDEGGKLLLVTGYSSSSYSNIQKITKRFGASLSNGVVMEQSSEHYSDDNAAYLLPNIITMGNGVITNGVEHVLMPSARGIKLNDEKIDGVTVSKIFATSESAVSVSKNIFSSENTVEEGPFYLGVSFAKNVPNGQGRLLWFTSKYISDEKVDEHVGGGNITTFLNGICWIGSDIPVPSVHGKTIEMQFITVPQKADTTWKIVIIFIVPITIIILGVIVVLRRRYK